MKQIGLQKSFSDHNPLWLQLDPCKEIRPKPFRSLDALLADPRFKPLIQHAWNSMGSLSLLAKLRALKGPIKSWIINHFRHLQTIISKLENEIDNLDSLGNLDALDKTQLSRKVALDRNLNRSRTRISQLFIQYSRVQNIIEKDGNTKFFHERASNRMRKKVINKIKVNGRMVKRRSNVLMKLSYFSNHFSQSLIPQISLH